jgi:hypothetical protein
VAFWAWRNQTPSAAEVERAVRETHASAIFLRAGQIHQEDDGRLRRVRPVTGNFPRGVELHLVYNSTRAVLNGFERIEPAELARVIAEAYGEDTARAAREGARVVGLQLDLDAPTRLLPHYARILRATRESLPQGVKLSVTGLPTWMESGELGETLEAVDFWIPQCYGARIPERLSQATPISSPQDVALAVARARALGRPFFAGLAAYGYAILYDVRGALVTIRGDLDPALVARDVNFELIERKPFAAQAQPRADDEAAIESEWRYVYRARADVVVDNLAVRAGETLMIDVPSAGALRASARLVRMEAGENLLGICVFRLPANDDPTTLSFTEVAAALTDTEPAASTIVSATRVEPKESERKGRSSIRSLRLTATNQGSGSGLLGDDALTVDVRLPVGSLRGVHLDGFSSVELLCRGAESEDAGKEDALRPCGERRANVLRLKSRAWMVGTSAQAVLSFDESLPATLAATTRVQTDDGHRWRREQLLTISDGDEP